MNKKRIGDLFMEKGILNRTQLHRVLRHTRKTGLNMGDAAIDLGFTTREALANLLGPSYSVDFYYLDSKTFPRRTQNILPQETMLRCGAVPLGIGTEYGFSGSKTQLRIGILDPSAEKALEEIQGIAAAQLKETEAFEEIKVYLVLAEQYLQVLKDVYGLAEDDIRKMDQTRLDQLLRQALEKDAA